MNGITRRRFLARLATLPAGAALWSAGCDSSSVIYDETEGPAAASTEPPEDEPRLAQGDIRFVQGYREGYQQALEGGKPLMVFFTAQWCHYCHEMAREAFTHKQVVALSERFVCVLVDADADPGTCREFRVRGYPTIQFISPTGVPLNRVTGKQPAHQLIIEMQAALQATARRQQRHQDGVLR